MLSVKSNKLGYQSQSRSASHKSPPRRLRQWR